MKTELLSCPFCGNTEPGFERVGTPRQSCIVACGGCGARHESGDEGENSGTSWNRRAQPAQAVPVLTDDTLLAMWAGNDERALRPVLGKNKILSFARAIEQAVRAKMGVAQTCEWALQDDDTGAWASSCGELWSFIDGGPAENRVRYCHGCGCKVGIVGKEGA